MTEAHGSRERPGRKDSEVHKGKMDERCGDSQPQGVPNQRSGETKR